MFYSNRVVYEGVILKMDQKELFDRLVENDTINNTISDTINDTTNNTLNLLPDNERTVFEQMRIRPEITANELSGILNINLRNTKNIIGELKEKGLVKRIGSRKAGHWEVVEK